jgi:peptidoglycan/LPS O-acetylase OafA/YrhL
MDRPALRALTGIRFFAALHVVFFHYAPALPPLLRNVAANGYMAVGLFFILSGFVLAYQYAGRALNPRRFLGARFARIYPAYLLGFVLIGPAVVVRLLRSDPLKLAASGLAAGGLVQGWFPKLALVWNGPGWSLSNEAFFYLLFPAILPAVIRLSPRGLWLVAAACWAAALAPPLAQLALYGGGHAEAVMYMPVFRLAEFVLGVAAGAGYLRREPGRCLSAVPVSVVLAGFAAFSPLLVHPVLRGALAAPLFAALVYTLASGGGILGQLLSWRPVVTLGNASYAIYILQSPLMAWFLLATRGASAESSRTTLGWAGFATYAAILTAVSLACHAWFETPARRWIQSWGVFRGPGRSMATPARRCKIDIDCYDPPDSTTPGGRGLRGLRPEIRWSPAAQAGSAVPETRGQPDPYGSL